MKYIFTKIRRNINNKITDNKKVIKPIKLQFLFKCVVKRSRTKTNKAIYYIYIYMDVFRYAA